MAVEIVMPKVDMVMESGTFVEWLKKEGEQVAKGEPLFIISTDKADIEVEAPASGLLTALWARPDDVVPVSKVIGTILQPGELSADAPAAPGQQPAEAHSADSRPVQPAPANIDRDRAQSATAGDGAKKPEKRVRSTPLARTLARERGLNLAEIPGSGPRGRIHRADIERYVAALEAGTSQPAIDRAAAPDKTPPTSWPAPAPGLRERGRERLKGARAIIAQRMALSASTIPHIHLTVQVDMSEAARLRERVNPVLEKTIGLKASYTAVIARAVSSLLPQHPYLNSSLIDDEIILWEDVHLGIAMNQGDHLIVPVLREAQTMSLEKLVVEMGRLLDLARQRKLPPSDLRGGTFTLSNLGMVGIASFTAIINPPEAAILAVGQIQETPVALDGEVVIRPMVTLALAADHRINDGARVAKFLGDLKRVLENPYLLI
jgi:pyruvate dehydrogenase E2 component (dihydrolipoamide acetyltransferase)